MSCGILLFNDVDSDETQAEDTDLTYVPEDDYSQVIPDSLEPECQCSICICMLYIILITD